MNFRDFNKVKFYVILGKDIFVFLNCYCGNCFCLRIFWLFLVKILNKILKYWVLRDDILVSFLVVEEMEGFEVEEVFIEVEDVLSSIFLVLLLKDFIIKVWDYKYLFFFVVLYGIVLFL